MQKKTAFEGSLPIVAAALGRYCGVRVEMSAGTPRTDGKTIHLPLISSSSPDEERKILGLLCHESAHIRFTDMKACDKRSKGLAFAIDNALEDARIEREMDAIYPGAERFFEAAHQDIVAKIVSKPIREDASIFPLYMLAVAECQILKREWLRPLVDKTQKVIEALLGNEAASQLMNLALEVRDAKSILDIQRIRKKAMKLLKASSQSNLDKSHGAGKDAKADSTASNGSSRKKTSQGGAASDKSHSSETEDESYEGSPRLKKMLESAEGKVVENPMSLSRAFEKIHGAQKTSPARLLPLSDALRPSKGDFDLGKKRLDQAKADSSALRTSLTGLVQSKQMALRRTTNRGRRIDTKRLSRLVVGNQKVFLGSAEKRGTNTAVHVLLDLSGSMGATGGDLAIRAALGLIHALQSIEGVNPALTVFPGTACGQSDYACCTVVGHGKRLSSIDPREIASLDAFGSTPMLEALMVARMALARCKESAKAVIVITDGGFFSEDVREIVHAMEEEGTRLFGVQILEKDGIDRMISCSEHIDEMADLKGVLFRFAKRLLLS